MVCHAEPWSAVRNFLARCQTGASSFLASVGYGVEARLGLRLRVGLGIGLGLRTYFDTSSKGVITPPDAAATVTIASEFAKARLGPDFYST